MDQRCPQCHGKAGALTRLVRVGEYRGGLRDLILRLKFGGQCQLDRWLASLMADAAVGIQEVRQAEALVPVPLSWRRRVSRGYNQAELLAYALRAELRRRGVKLPINRDLVRVRHTEAQTHLPISRREENLRGAFVVRAGTPLTDKRVCLVDDVRTTGATLRAAALALKRAGAKQISAVVLAVAGPGVDRAAQPRVTGVPVGKFLDRITGHAGYKTLRNKMLWSWGRRPRRHGGPAGLSGGNGVATLNCFGGQ